MTSLLSRDVVTEEPPSAAQTAVRRWRSWRGVVLFILVIFGITLVLATVRPRVEAQYLDPASAKRDGTRALAQIIGRRGTSVQVSRNAADATAQLRANPGALLVVVRSDRLLLRDLRTLATAPGDRLLIEPTAATLAALAPGVRRAVDQADTLVQPGCPSWADAAAAGSVGFGPGYTFETTAGSASQCYLDEKKPRLVRLATPSGSATTVVSSGTPFTNQHLAEHGNAALAMNLLTDSSAGTRRSVVWLIPDLPLYKASPTPTGQSSGGGDHNSGGDGGDGGGGNDGGGGTAADQTIWDLVPDGVYWAILQLAVATLLVGFWRGRRLGMMVAERLPVIVRSAETVEGRARLYRGRRARGQAAAALRAGTRERLVARLGIARRAAQDPAVSAEIIRAVASRTEWDETTIAWALYGPEPADDAELIRLSDFLGGLEARVLGT